MTVIHKLKGHFFDFLLILCFASMWLLPAFLDVRDKIDLSNMLAPPSWPHILGTDNLGRDLLGRVSSAIANEVIPIWAVVVGGSILGMMTVTFFISISSIRAWTLVPMFLVTLVAILFLSIPSGVAVFAVSVWQKQAGTQGVFLVLFLMVYFRTFLLLKSLYTRDKNLGFWQSNECLGGSTFFRIWHYGIKGTWRRDLTAQLSFHLQIAVIFEISLGYLGFGIQEPKASFGNIIASHYDSYLRGHWHILTLTALCLMICVVIPQSCKNLLQKIIPYYGHKV